MKQYVINSLGGDLAERIALCDSRMSQPDYTSDKVYQPIEYQWPGDWEGRSLLAMECLRSYYGRMSANHVGCLEALESHLNEDGYFGEIVDDTNVNEQQLAGNSWYLRALCESYAIEPSQKCLRMISDVVNNLYLKKKDVIMQYPIYSGFSDGSHYAAGCLCDKVGSWNLSSDSGCIYISLDGLSAAYEVLRCDELRELVAWLVDAFVRTDPDKKNFQAHAYLSGIRGMVRFYRATLDNEVLRRAKERLDYYLDTSLNLAYEGYGVVNKAMGSEGCAVVDQAMLCAQFYRLTHDMRYLNLYRKTYVNAIRTTQRSNGGLGCNLAVGSIGVECVSSVKEFAEANWCCTMRGCEGMVDFSNNLFDVEGDIVNVMLPNDGEYELFDGAVHIKTRTDYPHSGETVFEITKCDQPFGLRLDMSEGYSSGDDSAVAEWRVDGPCTLSMSHESKLTVKHVMGKTGYEYGDLVMGECLFGKSPTLNVGGLDLQPIVSFKDVSMQEVLKVEQRLLF